MRASTVAAATLVTILGMAAVGTMARSRVAIGAERAVHADVPARIDPAARYLFHLHGRAIEVQGPGAKTPWGPYLYADVLNALADRGFVVITEVRPATTEIASYAATVAGQVAKLRAAGVPAENITVTGFSKGGAIATLTTATIGDPRVNFVLLAGCLLPVGGRTPANVSAVGRQPEGRVLSLYDEGDTEAGSCANAFRDEPGVTFKEVVFHEGRGHGLFLSPSPVWVGPAVEWALLK
jgi:hypothetical protein